MNEQLCLDDAPVQRPIQDVALAALKKSAVPVLRVLPRCPSEFDAWTVLRHLPPLYQRNAVCSRLADLAEHGLVEKTGERRRGEARKHVQLWRLTDAGWLAARKLETP